MHFYLADFWRRFREEEQEMGGERANNRGDSTIKEEVRRRKMRKFASKQTKNNQTNNQTNGSKTEATLILCGYSGERANK